MRVSAPLLRLAVLATALAIAPSAFAQAWPTRPVRLVAAFPPATPGDDSAKWGTVAPQTQLQLD
jgi:tripartite-type tricarboxylate transporter receptor subunit TctC